MITPAWFFYASLSLFSSSQNNSERWRRLGVLGASCCSSCSSSPEKTPAKRGGATKKSTALRLGWKRCFSGGWFPTIRRGVQTPLSGSFSCVVNRLLSVEGTVTARQYTAAAAAAARRPTQKEVTYEIREGPLLPNTRGPLRKWILLKAA